VDGDGAAVKRAELGAYPYVWQPALLPRAAGRIIGAPKIAFRRRGRSHRFR